jgi:hypothetical protein
MAGKRPVADMLKRAGKRAAQFFVAVAIAAASAIPVSAQTPFSVSTYEGLLRPLNYLRGRANPYVLNKTDFFGGIDAAKATTFAWGGATWAPWGALVEDGWRIRFMGGAGLYSYTSNIVPGGINGANVFSAEVLGGYRKTFDNIFGTRLYVGAFAGVLYEDQILHLPDPFNRAQGSELGIKGSFEIYARVWERYIATGFATVASVHNKYYAKGTILRELNETWGAGGEIAAMGDARYTEYRVGLAGSFTWQRRIFILSVGALENSGRGNGFYTTFSVYSPL